ncbi:MAG: AAA family ATPase [Candidatus Thermoplasmatota archaeon]|nr:AAA family ATPase [Candidatus Thermoplasmatota archaeon]
MPSANIDITECLNQYLAIDNPGYAILIKGEWGCGKTWFINDFIHKSTVATRRLAGKVPNEFIKISLNGINSYEAIDQRLFFALHPRLDGEYTVLLSHLASGIFALAKVDSLLKNFKLRDLTHAIKTKVLVFDDLERCCMPVAETLGYINDFIEKIGLHVILIANEIEIDKIEKAAGNERITKYDMIKEKIIGQRFEVVHEINSVIENFIEKISTQKLRNELKKRNVLIIDIFTKSETNNLRTLFQSLLGFERLWNKLADAQKDSDDVLEKMLIAFLCFKFDIDKARIIPDDIRYIENYRIHQMTKNKNQEEKCFQIEKTFERYSTLNSFYLVLSTSAWANYFDKGYLSKEDIQECIDKSGLMPGVQSPLITLWHWNTIEDDELSRLVEESLDALKTNQIKSPFALLHLAGILIQLSIEGLIETETNDIVKTFLDVIDKLANSSSLEYTKTYALRSGHACWGSLRFQANETNEFQRILKYIVKKLDEIDSSKIDEMANKLPDLILTDLVTFIKIITYDSEETLYTEKPVLCKVDPQKFINSVIQLPNKLKWDPFHALQDRYANIYNRPELVEEISFLQEIAKLTIEYIGSNSGRNSTHQLEGALNRHLKKAINSINHFLNQKKENEL